MRLVALDTATTVTSVAVTEDTRVLAVISTAMDIQHTERLLPEVDFLLRETGFTAEDIDAVAVSLGPGSFTGLRIGLAAAKGLSMGWAKPLVGVPTLDALAERLSGVVEEGEVVPVLNAQRGEVYAARYLFRAGGWTLGSEYRVAPVAALAEEWPGVTHITGEGAPAAAAHWPRARVLPLSLRLPDAGSVGVLAARMAAKESPANLAGQLLVPTYVRGASAKKLGAPGGASSCRT